MARCLGQPLALDHAMALVVELGRRGVGLEHGCLCFLYLQEQRVVVVAADQQRDPGPGPDAADADDLAGVCTCR